MKFDDTHIEVLQRFLNNSPLIRHFGLTVEAIDFDAESITMRMPYSEAVDRGMGAGQVHGGAIATLIDTAGCFVLVMEKLDAVPTMNFRVDYLRPAVRSDLRAIAQVRRAGRSVGVVDIDVLNDKDQLVALGRGAFGL